MPSFEKFYNKYSAIIYGIALKISPVKKEADAILEEALQIVYKTIVLKKEDLHFSQLLHIIIKVSADRIKIPVQEVGRRLLFDYERSGKTHLSPA